MQNSKPFRLYHTTAITLSVDLRVSCLIRVLAIILDCSDDILKIKDQLVGMGQLVNARGEG
jgi:hypothetical protein